MLDRLCWRRRLAVRIVAAFLCLSALPSSKGFAGPIEHQGDLAESNAPVSPGPFVGTEPSILALYKTITYTATVLTTDQIWYMGIAEKAEDTGGLFGIVNTITSPPADLRLRIHLGAMLRGTARAGRRASRRPQQSHPLSPHQHDPHLHAGPVVWQRTRGIGPDDRGHLDDANRCLRGKRHDLEPSHV